MIRRFLAWLDLRRRARANLATRKAAMVKRLPHPERLAWGGSFTAGPR